MIDPETGTRLHGALIVAACLVPLVAIPLGWCQATGRCLRLVWFTKALMYAVLGVSLAFLYFAILAAGIGMIVRGS